MPYSKYDINWKRLILWIIPEVLRKTLHVAWVVALIAPVVRLYFQFISFRNEIIYALTITPQVCYLEKALNDRFDSQQRGIYITDPEEKPGLPLYLKVEVKPVVLFTKAEAIAQILYTKSESGKFGVDFLVNVPSNVQFDLQELTAFLSNYKLPSKKFKVVTV